MENGATIAKCGTTFAGGKARFFPYRVYAWRWVTSDIVILKLAPCEHRVPYLPGQYIKIFVSGSACAFSVANVPNAQGTIELNVRMTAGLRQTDFVHNLERKVFHLQGPFGRAYDMPADKPLVLVAGGTGIVPAKCLIECQLTRYPAQLIFLFWSAKLQEDLYLTDVFAAWMRVWQNFRYIPVLSRAGSATWSGKTGRVQELLLREFSMFQNAYFYASGPRVMVEEIRATLCLQGFSESNFFSDMH